MWGFCRLVHDGVTFYFIDNEHYFTGFAPYDGDPIVEYREVCILLKGSAEYPSGDRIPAGCDPLS